MKMLVFAMVFTVFSVKAEVSVTGIKVQPRSPWNGLVDVEYTVACDDLAADVYINPVVYDGDRRITMFPSSFTGGGWTNTVKAGKHKLVWDARKDFGAYSCANFQFKIYAGTRLAKYVKIDLSSGSESDNYPVTLFSVGPDVTKDECRTTELWLRLVPPGEFWMGSPKDEVGRSDNETLHHVTFTKPFYIGVFEVTQKQWELVMGDKPSYFKDSENWMVRPVEQVSYLSVRGNRDPNATTGFDKDSFLSRLRARSHVGGIDLPTESRWEYACRAGRMTALNGGEDLDLVTSSRSANSVGAFYGNMYNDQLFSSTTVSVGTASVGKFMANSIGLYDMHGNVFELCRDSIYDHNWGVQDQLDPLPSSVTIATGDGSTYSHRQTHFYAALRGGAWRSVAGNLRAAYRRAIEISIYDYHNGVTRNSWTDSPNNETGFRICAEAEF